MRQSFFLISTLAFIASFFISIAVFSANNDIIINEIGAFPTSTHEWIEVWNKGTEPVDLAGWKFWENNTNHGLTATTTGSIVAPGEYAAISQNSAVFLLDHLGFGGSIFDSSWGSLSETGEEIGLKDAQENFVEQFAYQPASERSLERKNPLLSDYSSNNWQEHLSGDTLGFQNSNYAIVAEATSTAASTTPASATTTPSSPAESPTSASTTAAASSSPPPTPSTSSLWAQIKINEFLPDPENGEEWIELYNPATTSLDLIGGLLCDSRETACAIAAVSGTIAAQGWTVFFLNGSHLNNGGDSVILKNPDGAITDRVSYGTDTLNAPKKGQAAARKNDGADTDADTDWAITTSPSPGSSNVIVPPSPPPPPPAPANNSGGGSSGGGGSVPPPYSAPPALYVPAPQKTAAGSTTSTAKTPNKGPAGDQVKIIWKTSAPRAAAPQETVSFSAAGSADPRGGAIFMSWDLGDGTIIDGQAVSHAYSASGTYRIVVFATSTQGTTGQQAFSISVAPGLSTRRGEVLISEIFPNPPGTDQGEFIELYNSASTSTSLAGWKLETSGGKNFIIPEKTSIKPGGFLVFYRAATRLVLDNTKEIVTLKTPDDVTVDQAAYGKSEPNQSLSLANGARGWTREITPGFIGEAEERKEQVLGEKITAGKISSASSSATRREVGQTSVRLAIAAARALKKGSAVIIQGVVTVPPGAFSEHYFYVADDSGGMQIYSSQKNLPPVAVGDKVRVAGQLSQANSAPRLKIASAGAIDILAAGQTAEAENLTLENIDEDAAGKLVTAAGEITDIKGNQLYLDDGETEGVVYLKTAAHIDRRRLKAGDSLRVTGIAERTKNGWQIWPRGNGDIRLSAKSPVNQPPNPNNGQAAKYAAVTALGLLLLAAAFFLKKIYFR